MENKTINTLQEKPVSPVELQEKINDMSEFFNNLKEDSVFATHDNFTQYPVETLSKEPQLFATKDDLNSSLVTHTQNPYTNISVDTLTKALDNPSISDEDKAILKEALDSVKYEESNFPPLSEIISKHPGLSRRIIDAVYYNELPSKTPSPDEFQNITKHLHDIYLKKNADYGSSFDKSFQRFGWYSVLVRLYDKFNRLESLTVKGNSPEVKSESIEDTLLDLANYAILTLLTYKKTSKTPDKDSADFLSKILLHK